MKQKLEGRYPASSDAVIKMMTDRKFYTDRLELQGLKEYEVVDHTSDGKNFSITIKRKVGPIAVTSVETWNWPACRWRCPVSPHWPTRAASAC
jgi:hypothetical protein